MLHKLLPYPLHQGQPSKQGKGNSKQVVVEGSCAAKHQNNERIVDQNNEKSKESFGAGTPYKGPFMYYGEQVRNPGSSLMMFLSLETVKGNSNFKGPLGKAAQHQSVSFDEYPKKFFTGVNWGSCPTDIVLIHPAFVSKGMVEITEIRGVPQIQPLIEVPTTRGLGVLGAALTIKT